MMKKLRFAPIVRVSTEKQEKDKHESLRTQTEQVKSYVSHLNGTIPDNCWQYSGQEHATPEQERRKLDRLLEDSAKDKFDAVIVVDNSRWSRDNARSKQGLDTLKKNGIRFFIATMEMDLNNPEHQLIMGVTTEINEFQAKIQALKSITNRINRARRNIPTAGKLPYGRTYDKDKGWGVDKEKQGIIQRAAERYLNGESIVEIAKSYGMNFSNLWQILTKKSGTEWPLRFCNLRLNIDQTVSLKIPPLLDEPTIEAIKQRADSRRTYVHGKGKKHFYLLGSVIFCKKCGYTLFGQTNVSGRRYYRHPRYRKKECGFNTWVPAEEIEFAVLSQLVKTFGDPELLQRAIDKATPGLKEVEKMEQEEKQLEDDLKNITRQKDSIVDAVADGTLTKDETKKKMETLRQREQAIRERIETLEQQMADRPDPSQAKKLTGMAGAVVRNALKNPKLLFERSYDWKRRLVEQAFFGKDSSGNRLGVYVEETGNPKKPWRFEIRGGVASTAMSLPISDQYLEELFELDPETQDVEKEKEKLREEIKSNFASYLQNKISFIINDVISRVA